MKVGSFEEIALILRNQGVEVQNFSELQPRYVKKGGYVGFPVGIDGDEWVAWVHTLNEVRPSPQAKADTAEWLTWHLIHAGGRRRVPEVMHTFLESEMARPDTSRYARFTDVGIVLPAEVYGVMRVERLCVLALMAAFMGFVTDPDGRDEFMVLPNDHPLADLAYSVPKLEKAVA